MFCFIKEYSFEQQYNKFIRISYIVMITNEKKWSQKLLSLRKLN